MDRGFQSNHPLVADWVPVIFVVVDDQGMASLLQFFVQFLVRIPLRVRQRLKNLEDVVAFSAGDFHGLCCYLSPKTLKGMEGTEI